MFLFAMNNRSTWRQFTYGRLYIRLEFRLGIRQVNTSHLQPVKVTAMGDDVIIEILMS